MFGYEKKQHYLNLIALSVCTQQMQVSERWRHSLTSLLLDARQTAPEIADKHAASEEN
jgi:hypothetical protein